MHIIYLVMNFCEAVLSITPFLFLSIGVMLINQAGFPSYEKLNRDLSSVIRTAPCTLR